MIPRYLVAALALTAALQPLSAQSVKAGIDAWQRSDYGGAVAIWRPLAEKGDADAQFNLGQAYRLGRGVPVNLPAAKTWLERAANAGHVDAETTLGLLLFQNGNQAAGLKWLKQAAAQGEPRALLVYGTALYNGDGVTQDQVLGYALVSRAAARGLAPAKETLAQLDRLMPLADRKKGIAIARARAKAAPPPSSKPEKPAQVASAKAAPKAQVGVVKPLPKPVTNTQATAQRAAKPPQRTAPQRITVKGGGWMIQLGAFSQRGAAAALYRRLAGKFPGRRPFYIPVGAVTRLQVGGFESKAAAADACRSAGTACFPVAAK